VETDLNNGIRTEKASYQEHEEVPKTGFLETIAENNEMANYVALPETENVKNNDSDVYKGLCRTCC
jgi:hypothetical protein